MSEVLSNGDEEDADSDDEDEAEDVVADGLVDESIEVFDGTDVDGTVEPVEAEDEIARSLEPPNEADEEDAADGPSALADVTGEYVEDVLGLFPEPVPVPCDDDTDTEADEVAADEESDEDEKEGTEDKAAEDDNTAEEVTDEEEADEEIGEAGAMEVTDEEEV